MKRFLLLSTLFALALAAVPVRAQSTVGTLHVLVEQSDGTYKEVRLANTSSTSATASGPVPATSVDALTATLPLCVTGMTVESESVVGLPLVSKPSTLVGKYTQSVTFASAYATGVVPLVSIIPNLLVSGGQAANVTNAGFTLVLPLTVTGNIGYLSGTAQ